MLITQSEIIELVTIDDKFSVNNIKDAQIQKAELVIADSVLGVEFYNILVSDKTGKGTFTTEKYQNLYNDYLRLLIAEYVILSIYVLTVLELNNKRIDNADASTLDAIKLAKKELNEDYQTSLRLIKNYLTDPVRASDFSEFLDNKTTPVTEKIQKNNLAGFYF